MGESLLDYIGKNPNSRLDKSPFENVNVQFFYKINLYFKIAFQNMGCF